MNTKVPQACIGRAGPGAGEGRARAGLRPPEVVSVIGGSRQSPPGLVWRPHGSCLVPAAGGRWACAVQAGALGAEPPPLTPQSQQ